MKIISVVMSVEEYEQVRLKAFQEHKSVSAYCRRRIIDGDPCGAERGRERGDQENVSLRRESWAMDDKVDKERAEEQEGELCPSRPTSSRLKTDDEKQRLRKERIKELDRKQRESVKRADWTRLK
jgi:hypothetical protein